MTREVQVTFRNMAVSPALEEEVRARAAWLETFYSGLIGCRVVLEIPHRHRERGNPVHVRVELALPGDDIVVSHEPTVHADLQRSEADSAAKGTDVRSPYKDAKTAIHDAFDVVRRRLEEHADRQRGDVKAHLPLR